jgi:hypothetical protein
MSNQDPLIRALASRGIIRPSPEPEAAPIDPFKAALDRYHAALAEIEAEKEAKRKADAAAELAAQPTPVVVGQAIALNGAGILNAATAGVGGGSINGGNQGHQSVARMIESEIMRGRHE